MERTNCFVCKHCEWEYREDCPILTHEYVICKLGHKKTIYNIPYGEDFICRDYEHSYLCKGYYGMYFIIMYSAMTIIVIIMAILEWLK